MSQHRWVTFTILGVFGWFVCCLLDWATCSFVFFLVALLCFLGWMLTLNNDREAIKAAQQFELADTSYDGTPPMSSAGSDDMSPFS